MIEFLEKFLSKKSRVFYAFVIINILCYGNALFCEFVWDDISHLNYFQLNLKSFTDLFQFFFTTNVVGQPFYYRPLMLVSFGIDYLVFKSVPFGYHLTSLILHLLNVILVFKIAERLLKNQIAAFIGAVIFAIHPVQAEAVTWISARADTLATFFTLLSFYFYMNFVATRGATDFILVLLFYTLSLFTKETSLILFFVFLIYPFAVDKKINDKKHWSLLVFSFIIIIFYLLIRGMITHFVLDYYPWNVKIATIPVVILSYFKLFFYPIDLKHLYPFPSLITNPLNSLTVSCWAFLILYILLILWL